MKSFDDFLRSLARPPEAEASMTWDQLLQKRRQTTDPAEQARIAPFEHRAFAREYVAENPLAAPGLALMTPGYYLAKKLGLSRGRTEPSLGQVGQGLTGIGEGLINAFRTR